MTSLTHQRAQIAENTQLRSDRVHRGASLWLPRPTRSCLINVTDVAGHRKFHPTAYGHPILVLSRPATAPDMVDFVILTSLGSGIGEFFKRWNIKKRLSNEHIPIEPAHRHVFYKVQARYKDGLVPKKDGFISSGGIYSVAWRDLWPCIPLDQSKTLNPGPWGLDERSMRTVTKWAHARCDEYFAGEIYRLGDEYALPGDSRPRSDCLRLRSRPDSDALDNVNGFDLNKRLPPRRAQPSREWVRSLLVSRRRHRSVDEFQSDAAAW